MVCGSNLHSNNSTFYLYFKHSDNARFCASMRADLI